MADQLGMLSRQIESLLSDLGGYLHSEMSIGQPGPIAFGQDSRATPEDEEEGVEATIHVQNTAPPMPSGGEVVFVGVGLAILDGREAHRNSRWVRGIVKSRPSDHADLRKRYSRGDFVPSSSLRFPATTSAEESHGEVLFRGESVLYEIKIPMADLPYTSMHIEGSVSRRHLLRFSKALKDLDKWTKPLLVDTFRALNGIDFHGPLQTATSAIPEFGPQTTLQELAIFQEVVQTAIDQIKSTSQNLNEVFHSAPRPEIREHLKQVVGSYLSSTRQALEKVQEAVSSRNTEEMRRAGDALKAQGSLSEEVDRRYDSLISQMEIDRSASYLPS